MISLILLIIILIFVFFHFSLSALFINYIKKESNKKYPDYFPKISLITPCKGLEINLKNNLNSVLNQDYPKDKIEYIFVVAEETDSAIPLLKKLNKEAYDKTIKIVVSKKIYKTCSEKLSNLINALNFISEDSEVLVFLDSDLKIKKSFVKKLVQPLRFEKIGATTGYRYYKPDKTFSSYVRSSYVFASSLFLCNEKTNFTFGGATAIKKELFFKLKINEIWKSVLTDDFTLTKAVKSSGKKIKFIPYCIGISCDSFSSLKQTQKWINRQVKIMQIYDKQMFFTSLFVYSFVLLFILFYLFFTIFNFILIFPLLVIILFFVGINILTGLSVKGILDEETDKIFLISLSSFFVLVIFLLAVINSLFSKKVRWRDIEYIINSPYNLRRKN